MDYRDKIFEMLGVESGEEFRLNESIYIYKIDDELNIISKDKDGKWSFVDAELEYLQDILKGRMKIKKNVKPTLEDEIIFSYGRLCGYNWIAIDKDGKAYFYGEKPYRTEGYWRGGEKFDYIGAEIHCLSWEDEPYYIGE